MIILLISIIKNNYREEDEGYYYLHYHHHYYYYYFSISRLKQSCFLRNTSRIMNFVIVWFISVNLDNHAMLLLQISFQRHHVIYDLLSCIFFKLHPSSIYCCNKNSLPCNYNLWICYSPDKLRSIYSAFGILSHCQSYLLLF